MEGFKNFIMRGNVVDLAVGVVIGASFGAVVDTLVKGILTPLIGALVKAPDFSGLFFTINGSKFMYGEFINAIISFVIVAGAIYFFVVKPLNMLMERMKKPEEAKEPMTKTCKECLSEIHKDAKRCANCAEVQ
jgi:large conductance mechanosensitive channel